MAPGSDNRQDSIAPDKNLKEGNVCGIATNINNNTNVSESKEAEIVANVFSQTALGSDNQEESALSTLNERELQALLDEAITYTGSTKDRERKSNLFKELLQEAEVDDTEEGHRVILNSRCIPNTTRRKHKRDSISDRLTHGGSLQNLAHPLNSEFENFPYLTSGSSHTYSGGRKKNKKHTGPSVSARQREGGSLPSNVNASHNLATFINLDLIFDKKKGYSNESSIYDWKNEDNLKPLEKSSFTMKKDGEECDNLNSEMNDANKSQKLKLTTTEMLVSDNQSESTDYKTDYMVINIEVNGMNDKTCTNSINFQRPPINSPTDREDEEGIEMKVMESKRSNNNLSCTTLDSIETPVDSTIEFPFRDHSSKQDKGKITINGTLQLTTYNNAKCNMSGTSAGVQQSKIAGSSLLPIMHVSGTQPNIAMAVSRLTAQNTSTKDFAMSIDKKSLDENGNAVQTHNGERKKSRRKYAQEPNVIVYKAENVEGHRNEDIDSLINFIESKESKGKKGKTNSNSVKVKSATGQKSRGREKDSKRESLTNKLQKSNSLEEISKTKLEDLTVERSASSSGASNISSHHGTFNMRSLRRAKQRSTGDSTIDCRGDRRSWGTEEGQSIYCNDIGDDYINYTTTHISTIASTAIGTNPSTPYRNSCKKWNSEVETESEFFIVAKKKKTKRQRRSSSGGRSQNLVSSASYLPRTRDFVRDHRTPLLPELRRKSVSSMPPSDKSDSSDLDSVHSLPVTSNTKHNLSKKTSSSVSVSQASYADITRMASINLPPSSVLSISSVMPSVITTACWPSISSKSPSEPDKFPNDYYPSLEELQQTDRKIKQHIPSNLNQIQDLNLNFDKHLLPATCDIKYKNSNESKKAEAREEAINKKIQVIKYVQEQKNLNANTNYTPNKNEEHLQMNINSNVNSKNVNGKHSKKDSNSGNSWASETNSNSKISTNHQRSLQRKNQQILENTVQISNQMENNELNQSSTILELKKINYKQFPGNDKKESTISIDCFSVSTQDCLELKNTNNYSINTINVRNQNKSKSNPPPDESAVPSMARFNVKLTNTSNFLSQNEKNDNPHIKKSTYQTSPLKKDIIKTVTQSMARKSSRPAVILMDETQSNHWKDVDSSSELTFGFEVNEELLQLENKVPATRDRSISENERSNALRGLSANFESTLPLSVTDKNMKEKNKNFHTQTLLSYQSERQVSHSPVVVPSMPYFGYTPGYQAANTYVSATSQSVPSNIIKKFHRPQDDFCARYIAPEEKIHLQHYNHDKIVTFVGLAWDAIMREIPVTESRGRVQYYSGQ